MGSSNKCLEMGEISDGEFEKCGEIIIAVKKGAYAFVCHLCQDVFVHMTEFMRHLRHYHNDELQFERHAPVEEEVYTYEELLQYGNSKEQVSFDWTREDDDASEMEYSDEEMDETSTLEKSENDIEAFQRWTDELVHSADADNSEIVPESFIEPDEDTEKQQSILRALEKFDIHSDMLEHIEENIEHELEEESKEDSRENPDLMDLLQEFDDGVSGIELEVMMALTKHKNGFKKENNMVMRITEPLEKRNHSNDHNETKSTAKVEEKRNLNFSMQDLNEIQDFDNILACLEDESPTYDNAECPSDKLDLKHLEKMIFNDEEMPLTRDGLNLRSIENVNRVSETSLLNPKKCKKTPLKKLNPEIPVEIRNSPVLRPLFDQKTNKLKVLPEEMKIESNSNAQKSPKPASVKSKTTKKSVSPTNTKLENQHEEMKYLRLCSSVNDVKLQCVPSELTTKIKANLSEQKKVQSNSKSNIPKIPNKSPKSPTIENTPEKRQNLGNTENTCPSKVTTPMYVKVQRLSPEMIAKTQSNLKKNSLNSQTNRHTKKKNTFNDIIEKKRLQNCDYLASLLNESNEDLENIEPNENLQSSKKMATTPNKRRPSRDDDNSAANRASRCDDNLLDPGVHTDYKPQQQIPSISKSVNTSSNLRFPASLQITKIKTNIKQENTQMNISTETPIKSGYSKQNFTESMVNESLNEEHKSIELPPSNGTKGLRQRKASIDVVSAKTPISHNNLDAKSYAVLQRSARKKEVLTRMRSIKKRIFQNIDMKPSVDSLISRRGDAMKMESIAPNSSITKQPKWISKDSPTILSVEMLPKLNVVKPEILSKVNSVKTEKSPPPVENKKNSIPSSITFTNFKKPIASNENKRKSQERKVKVEKTSPRSEVTPELEVSSELEVTSELDATNMDLTDSVVEFLHEDLKSNHLDVTKLGSLLSESDIEMNTTTSSSVDVNEEADLLEDLLKQVAKKEPANVNSAPVSAEEVKSIKTEKKKNQKKNSTETSASDIKADMQLLHKVGLVIVKHPEVETGLPLRQIEAIQKRAREFANIFQKFTIVWNSKSGEQKSPEQLEVAFGELTQRISNAFNLKFHANEMKRLANMITLWYTSHCNLKLIEKKKISKSVEYYLKLFAYMPKTSRRTFYCEHCDQMFRLVSQYNSHRLQHSGENSYPCNICQRSFARLNNLNAHLRSHRTEKCATCNQRFNAAAELTDHKCNMYSCQECKMTFESDHSLVQHQREHAANEDFKQPLKLSQVNVKHNGTPRPKSERVHK